MMDSGKENDDEDFQTVIRHSRRKNPSIERSRGKQMYNNQHQQDSSSRGRRHIERDRERQQQHQRERHGHRGVSSKGQNNNQNHPPTVQSNVVVTNGGGGFVNGLTVKRSSGGVANGSICSESGSSSLGTTESFVHSTTNSNGLLEVDMMENNTNNEGSSSNGIPGHIRHLSGGSGSGSASSLEAPDNVHDIAQSSEDPDNNKPQFIVAPPPTVNPWQLNSNAASIIAKKPPGSQILQTSVLTKQQQQSSQKKPVTAATTTGDKVPDTKTKSTTPSFANSQQRSRGKQMLPYQDRQDSSRIRRHVERDRERQYQNNQQQQRERQGHRGVSSQGQQNHNNNQNHPPTVQNKVVVTNETGGGGIVNGKRSGVANGSICSESGSSSLGATESLVHTSSGNGLTEAVVQNNEHVNNAVPDHHIRHSSGDSLSGSASSLEAAENVHDIAQSSEEADKLEFIVAPPPAVNPWQLNSNAASIIAKKPSAASQIQPIQLITKQLPSQKKPVGPDDTKTNHTASLTNISANSQTVEQSPAPVSSLKIQATSKSITEPSQQTQRKDIHDQGLRPQRAFAAVTKSHKEVLRKGLKVGNRTSEEDWPTLQEALVSPTATPTTPVAHGKSVIAVTHEPVKTTKNRTSATDSTTDSESQTPQQRKQKLPSDKWPSISDSVVVKDAKTSHTLIHNNNSDMVNDDTPSEASNSGDAGEQQSTKKLQNGITTTNSQEGVSENGSVSSSDDGLVENELDADAQTGKTSKGKKSKQKWVPLDLPETPSSKSKGRKDRSSVDRDWEREKERDTITKPKVRHPSNKEDVSNNVETRSNHTYVARGRGRNTGVRGRTGRGKGGNHHWNYRDVNDMNGFSSSDPDYTDYPPDYTTLPPMYPVTEFIMPYMTTNGYFPATYTPPPTSGAVVDDAQLPITTAATTYVQLPVDETVVNDMVKKQIEYYFSEENLEKDFYLRRKMDEEGFLPVNFIATFPRVKNMTQDYNMVIQAIQASPDLELKKDLSCLRTIHDPTKWPILDETSVGLTAPHNRMPAPPAKIMAYQTPNGFVSLSGSPIPTFQIPNIVEKFNPNVPEFVPKLKIAETV